MCLPAGGYKRSSQNSSVSPNKQQHQFAAAECNHSGFLMTHRRISIGGIQYRVDEELGHGLHSTVYGGHDLRDGQPVAIKIVNFSPGFIGAQVDTESRRQSYWKEVEMLLHLQSMNPYVIRVYNYDHNDRYGMIVMERGETFRDRLVDQLLTGAKMPASSIQKYWSQMVSSIYYLHRIGIVHGDCKPENFIQIGSDGSTLRLIDMGISFQMPPNVTSRLHTAAGTPGKSRASLCRATQMRTNVRLPSV